MAKFNEHLARGPIDIDLGPDVVRVVRCKDCKWYHDFGTYWDCRNTCGMDCVQPDDFCSYGKQKDGDGNG